MYKQLISLFLFIFIISCTQFLEQDTISKNTYTGNDGCIYCHTNKERLKVLAPDEGDGGGGGGG